MKPSLIVQSRHLLDDVKSRRLTVPLLVLLSFFLVSWATAATPFGSRGSLSGDDWYFLANIALGEFPACIGSNSINPWRPLQPTSYCVLYQVVGLNLPVLYTATALVLTCMAFVWYGMVRDVFKVSRWMAFAIGLIFLAYPDHLFRLSLIEGIRLVGPLATLCGMWAVLIFWERPRKTWLLVVACLLTLYGQLTYETLIAAWGVGLPLALLYKSHRLSWRWLRVTLVVELVTISYFIWRYLILPTTYTEKTVIAGAHNAHLALETLLRQARDSFLYVIAVWPKNLYWFDLYRMQNSGANILPIVAISAVIGLLTLLGLVAVYRLDRGQMQNTDTVPRWRDIFLAAFLLVGIMALPFYVIPLDWMVDTYRSFGTPFAASVGLVALLWLVLRQQRLVVPVLSIIVVGMVIFRTVFSGYTNAEWQRESSYACDFFVRFTDIVERLPQNVYVIVTAPRGRVLPTYFDDAFRLTAHHALLYFEGPYVPESYDYGRMGHTGYLIIPDSHAELTADGISFFGNTTVTESLHSRSPLPKFAPLDHTIFVKYDPYRELTILSSPEHLEGLVMRPEGGATSRASRLVRHLCDWDQATSALVKRLDQVKQSRPTAAVSCNNGDVTIYQINSQINGGARSVAFQVSKADLDKIPQHPATNALIAQANKIRLYRLTSGELQINAPVSSPEQGEYVYIWGGCSR